MTRDYAPTRPVRRRRFELTGRGWAAVYVTALVVALLLGLTAEAWNPYAQVTP